MPAPLHHRVPAVLGVLVILVAGCGAAATPAPTPTPRPSPTMAPTPTPVDVAATFLAAVTQPNGRLPVSGTATFGDTAATISGMFESSGPDDSSSTMTIDVGGSTQTNESIRIGTQRWTRENDGVWVLDPEPAGSSAGSTKTLSGWLRSLTALDDRGVETKDGRQLHQLVPSAAEALTADAMGLDPSIQDAVITVEFWAEDDGTPAVMSIGMSWNQASGTTTMPVEMALDIDLGGLGAPASVSPPEEAWTGFLSERFGYRMAYAPDWSVQEDEGTDVYLLEGTPYIYVSPQELDAGYTLERLRDELVAYYEEQDINAAPEADEEYAVGGLPARLLTYRFTNASGNPVFLLDAVTVRGSTGWEIYLAQSQTGEEEARAFFDTMLATLSFAE